MKILYTNFHPYGSGGHAPYILNLLHSFQGEHELTVATPASSRLFRLAGELAPVRRVDSVYSTRLWPMLQETGRLRRVLQQGRFDLVHVNGSADHRQVMVARQGLRHRPRVVWTKHNTKPVGSPGNRVRAWFGTDGAIGVCDFVSRQLQASPYACRPIRTIRLGVDTDYFQPPSAQAVAQARRDLLGDCGADTLVLASVGGTDRDKGWIFLVRALSRLPQALRQRVRLLIAGDPPPPALRQEVLQLGLGRQVHFPGQVADPRRVLAAGHISFVLSVHEAGSYAVCESLSMGVPSLVSDAGGLPELVREDADGWVLPRGDVSAIEAWLRQQLKQPLETGFRPDVRKRALKRFCRSIFAQQTMDFYREICT